MSKLSSGTFQSKGVRGSKENMFSLMFLPKCKDSTTSGVNSADAGNCKRRTLVAASSA